MKRREFLQSLASVGLGLWGAGEGASAGPGTRRHRTRSPGSPSAPEGKPRVVIARHSGMMEANGRVNPEAVQQTVEEAVAAFGEAETATEVWARYYRPTEVIGLKVNCLAGPHLSTRPAVAYAVARGLIRSGVPAARIIIWDRENRELRAAGYQIVTLRRALKCLGTDTPRVGYEEELSTQGSFAGRLSRILARFCTAQVNLPLIKDHGITGFTGALKNYLGAIHNPNRMHEGQGNPGIADLNCVPALQRARRLIVGDALTLQYEGGPSFDPRWNLLYNAILVASDPVAFDVIGWELINEARRGANLRSLEAVGRTPTYITTAADAEHHLGTADRSEIEVIELTVG